MERWARLWVKISGMDWPLEVQLDDSAFKDLADAIGKSSKEQIGMLRMHEGRYAQRAHTSPHKTARETTAAHLKIAREAVEKGTGILKIERIDPPKV